MPKPASDSLLTCTVTPAPDQPQQDDAAVWAVNVSEFCERLGVQPGSPAQPDPYVEADFTILQTGAQLTVVRWSITGTEMISTRKSRIPLQTYARAALIAVEDALEASGRRSRRGHVSAFEMSNGRLIDPQTREQRKPSRRQAHTAANGNGKRPTLDLAQVVDEYRKAIERGSRSPTVDVAHALNVGRSTAARALAAAREQRLLGPALRNRAGEERT